MVQAGGWFTNEDQTEATAASPENEEALTYLQDNLAAGNFKHAAGVEAGWGGEAFGTGKAAMTVEGPWLIGAINADYPDVQWMAAELPEGPAGQGTLTFSNCWGIAADGDTENAVELVKHFTSPEEQQAFTEAFGVNPSRISLEEWNAEAQPEKAAFNAGVDYAKAPPSLPGFASVKSDFMAQLEALASGAATPAEVLERLQQTTEEVIAEQ
jgi:multiple sugar transport system substrate-binding protein